MSSPVELRPEGTDGGCLLGAEHTFGLTAVGEGDQQRLVSVCRACGRPERERAQYAITDAGREALDGRLVPALLPTDVGDAIRAYGQASKEVARALLLGTHADKAAAMRTRSDALFALHDAIAGHMAPASEDTARLDWLQAHGESVGWIDPSSGDASACHLVYSLNEHEPDEAGGGTIREAIDAARAQADEAGR